jgi:hypothetical protein
LKAAVSNTGIWKGIGPLTPPSNAVTLIVACAVWPGPADSVPKN